MAYKNPYTNLADFSDEDDDYMSGGAFTRFMAAREALRQSQASVNEPESKKLKVGDEEEHTNSNEDAEENPLEETSHSSEELSENVDDPGEGSHHEDVIDPNEAPSTSEDVVDPGEGPSHSNNEHLVTSTVEYDKDTIVISNDLVECHIYRAFHRHQKIFQSEDHLYKMYFKPKTDKPILWSSIENILEDALAVVIRELQKKYATDREALLYFAIDQNSLVNGLRSSVHVLKENTTRGMVQNVMSTFNSFLNSNQNIELNSTFEVYFKVLSGVHVAYAGHRRRAIPLRTMVGHRGSRNGCFQPGGLLDLPTGHVGQPDMFKDQCLLLCMQFQYLRLTEPAIKTKLDSFVKKTSSLASKITAAEILKVHMKTFCRHAKIEYNGPHELFSIAKQFAQVNNCQIVVINSMDGWVPQFTMFPTNVNLELPRIYLFAKNNHVFLIDNLKAFWRKEKKYICLGCKRMSSHFNHNHSHNCAALPKCVMCRGLLQTAQTKIQSSETFQFCDAKLNALNVNKHCDKCGNTFPSIVCFTNHLLRCAQNKTPYHCQHCGALVSQNMRSTHICGVQMGLCRICFKIVPANHECSILKQTETKHWPNVGTLIVTFKSTSTSDCQKCYKAKMIKATELKVPFEQFIKHESFSSVTCDSHTLGSDLSKANAICMWSEKQRGIFDLDLFVDDILEDTKSNLDSADSFLKRKIFTYTSSQKPFTTMPPSNSKKIKTISTSLNQMLNMRFTTAEEKFFQHIVRGNLQNCTIVVDNDQVMHKLLEIFLTFQVQPQIVQKGRQIFCLELTQFSVKFLNFVHYAPGCLESWLLQFTPCDREPFFPEIINTTQNLQCLNSVILKFEDFISFGDTQERIAKKKAFFETLSQPVNFKELLITTLLERSNVFFRIVMQFLLESFRLERLFGQIFQKDVANPIHPFGDKIVSCSSFIHSLCQFYVLNNYNICTVPNPYSNTAAAVSIGEYEYTSYLAYEHPDLQVQTAFNNPNGQQRFGKITADAYSPVSKTIYNFFGCFHHCHDPHVCLNKRLVDKNPHLARRKQEIDQHLIDRTKTMFPLQVNDVKITWECEWAQFKRNNIEKLERFWSETGLSKNRPMIKLVPRAAVRGGFLETYQLKCVADENTKITWIDANSLYSFIALQCPLPVGQHKVLTFGDLKNRCLLDPEDGMFYYEGESMECDVAMVEILCPANLKRPFLSYRIQDEFVFLSNCKKCATLKQTDRCKHSERDRSFTSTWTVVELAYAVHKLGYVIKNWFELHHYQNSAYVLKEFVQVLASQKLQCSGILTKCSSNVEKLNLCEKVNQAMSFTHPDLRLTPSNCSENSIMQSYLKLCLNSLYGRFALHSNNIHHIFCRNIHDIEVHTSNPNVNVLDFITINDNIVEMVIDKSKKGPQANKHSNLYFTALINARGRIFIYDLSKQLEALGCSILSIDTDSICFSHLKSLQLPITISPAFGHFKHCLGENTEISAFYSLGVRSYLLLYKDETGCERYLTKIKGLSLGSQNVINMVTPSLFKEFLESRFRQEIDNIYIPQCRKRLNKQTKTFRQIISTHEFTNEIHCKRFIVPNDNSYVTHSYGYKT